MGWTKAEVLRRNIEIFGDDTWRPGCKPGEPPADIPESQIEAECTKLLEEDGWRALRTDPVSDRGRGKGFGELGMADHLYIRYPRGERDFKVFAQILWIEFKSAKGKPAKHQISWHQKERARGALTLIAGEDFPASVEGFKQWYAGSGLSRAKAGQVR